MLSTKRRTTGVITLHSDRYFFKELVETKNRAKRELILDKHLPGCKKKHHKWMIMLLHNCWQISSFLVINFSMLIHGYRVSALVAAANTLWDATLSEIQLKKENKWPYSLVHWEAAIKFHGAKAASTFLNGRQVCYCCCWLWLLCLLFMHFQSAHQHKRLKMTVFLFYFDALMENGCGLVLAPVKKYIPATCLTIKTTQTFTSCMLYFEVETVRFAFAVFYSFDTVLTSEL